MNKLVSVWLTLLLAAVMSMAAEDRSSFPKGQLRQAEQPAALAALHSPPEIHDVLYRHDFTISADGWVLESPWQMIPTRPEDAAKQLLCSNQSASYPSASSSHITGPRLSLPELDSPSQRLLLEIREQYEIESYYDRGLIELSADDGATWTAVHSRSGLSGWRDTAVDISQFAGQPVRIAFHLQSDSSVQYAGWQIASLAIGIAQSQQLSASLVSLNPQGFPDIYMNVAVNSGTALLNQSNFSVYENSVRQTGYFQVTPPQAGSGSRLADVIFIMDNSGSMSDNQNAVRNNVVSFVDNLAASGVNYALGLCRFGMTSGNGDPVIENNGQLTQDAAWFKNTLWTQNVVDGGREPGYDAIIRAISALSFRPGAQKILIIITDEEPNQGSSTVSQVLNACTSTSASLFVLTEAALNSYYTTLTAATNGAIYDINDNFNSILQYISAQVSNNYLVQYRSSNPVADGTERLVEVRINHNSEQVSVYGSYIPGAVPQIICTPATLALSSQAWAAGSTLTIEVEVIDRSAPYVSAVTLYYRTTGTTNWQSILLSAYGGSIWRVTIPTHAVITPGVDYYITATDGITTVSSPAVSPIDFPWQIAILPNVAPAITHTPVTQSTSGTAVPISAQVRDNTNRLAAVRLYYKRTGQLIYQFSDLSLQSGATYYGEIPAGFLVAGGCDYFIKAWDDFGLAASHGSYDSPHHIVTSGSGGQPILLDPVSRKIGVGTKLWLSWQEYSSAVAYQLQVGSEASLANPEVDQNDIIVPRSMVDGLRPESRYFWRVRALLPSGYTPWSDTWLFTTFAAPPVQIDHPDSYVMAYLEPGDQYYIDRTFIINAIPPAFGDLLWIKTANDDQLSSSSAMVSFTLLQNAMVYVAVDSRIITPPGWLQNSFSRLGETLQVADKSSPLTLYWRAFPAGTHSLGGNLAYPGSGARSNYLILFDFPVGLLDPVDHKTGVGTKLWLSWSANPAAHSFSAQIDDDPAFGTPEFTASGIMTNRCLASGLEWDHTYYWRVRAHSAGNPGVWSTPFTFTTMSEPAIQLLYPDPYVLGYLAAGDQYYVDREYVVTGVPDPLKNLLWIKSANEDRFLSSGSVLTFHLEREATLFIAMDNRLTALPQWLTAGWTNTGYTIRVAEKADPLRVWQATFPSGTHSLGGNFAPPASGGKSNYVVLVKFSAAVRLSGRVSLQDGTGVDRVELKFSGGLASLYTQPDGTWQKYLPPGWSGTITPAKSGYSFSPPTRSYPALSVDMGQQDFTALKAGNLLLTFSQINAAGFPDIECYLSVTDGAGVPVSGLTLADLNVSEDAILQNPTSLRVAGTTQLPIAVALVVDRSGSMQGQSLADAKQAATDFLQRLKPIDHAAIISFASNVTINQPFTANQILLQNAIQSLTASGQTDLYGGVIAAIDQGQTQTGRKAVIVLTDGEHNVSGKSLADASSAALQAGLPVYTIGLGDQAQEDNLRQLASATGGRYYHAPTSADLAQIYNLISLQLTNQYILTYTTTNATRDGSIRTVTIQVMRGGESDQKSRTYMTPSNAAGCPIAAVPEVSACRTGDEFWLDIAVGTLQAPVTDLFGLSLVLSCSPAAQVEVVPPTAGSIIAGPMLGSDLVQYSDYDAASGNISIGLARKSGAGGVSGAGIVARIRFRATAASGSPATVRFALSQVNAIDVRGSAILLSPAAGQIQIIAGGLTVWPGDGDHNGMVNQNDVLPIGFYWHQGGPARASASMQWSGQFVQLWPTSSAAHADGNGDGIVDEADILPIGLNWGRNHTLATSLALASPEPTPPGTAARAELKPLVLARDGSQIALVIKVTTAQNLHGLALEMPLPKPEQARLERIESLAGGSDQLLLFSRHDAETNRLALAIARHAETTPWPQSVELCRIHFSLTGGWSGDELVFTTEEVFAIDNQGQFSRLESDETRLIAFPDGWHKEGDTAEDRLFSNRPNPFNSSTRLSYQLAEDQSITLAIYNMLGAEIRRLEQGAKSKGVHTVLWDGRDDNGQMVTSGLYFCYLRTPRRYLVQKMLLVQ